MAKELTVFRAISAGTVKALPRLLSPPSNSGISSGGGWWPITREPYAGAWQQNCEIRFDCVVANPTVFACATLIASDVAKCRIKLTQELPNGICKEVSSPSFSPVLAKQNRYQTRIDFMEQWIISKAIWGNAYVLKERDRRGVVIALYVLNPLRVWPLIAIDGSIFYQLSGDNLTGLLPESVIVPASEIIHDRMNCLFHPLIGLSPIFACGLAATQADQIVNNTARFFKGGAKVSGILTVPGSIPKDKADALKAQWDSGYTGENSGKVAVLADGVKFQQLTMSAVDSELIDQLKWSDEKICETFHVPAYKVGVGTPPPYNNIEALSQQYYSDCLQTYFEHAEACLDEGLGLDNAGYYSEFDLTSLLRMDTAARIESSAKAVGAGIMTPNEARALENLPPLEGGDTTYLQQQYFALSDLAKRSLLPNPFVIDKPTSNPAPSESGPVAEADPAAAASKAEADAQAYAVAYTKDLLDLISREVEHGTA
jgi:HK97 family phage portal protein